MATAAGAETLVKLSNGTLIPVLGLGVYQASGRDCYTVCLEALRRGYRHIDTAAFYGNEAEVGRAVRDSGLPRDAVWITTKLWVDQAKGGGAATRAFQKSARLISGDDRYDAFADRSAAGTAAAGERPVIDLYLIHAPVERTRMDAWKEMEDLYLKGHVRAIGVSNYGNQTLGVKPVVNQIEIHPFFQRRAIIEMCRAHDIAVQAYSPLTKGQLVRHSVVAAAATKLGKTPAQILIRWSIQKGLIPLPKTVKTPRLVENMSVFGWEIPPEVMQTLDALEAGEGVTWDPTEWD
ncbi:NADP-dependent oxidoreductase domain-containing protein [Zopfochytrium polystomum]|nr:NADP-dependent oxidoreductase domain-containing protein [Zopfochytrium polystomum]